MLENKHELQKDPLLLVGAAALMMGMAIMRDYIKGGQEIASLDTEARLLTHEVMDAGQTVIQFVGCMQDAEVTDEELAPLVPGVNLIVVKLPQMTPDGTIDHDSVSAKIVKQLVKTHAWKPAITADSKGAQDAVELFQYVDRMGLNELFGGFGKVVFNASPHDGEDIKESRQWQLALAEKIKHFRSANRARRFVMRLAGHDSPESVSLSEIVLAGRDVQRAAPVNPLPDNFEELTYIRGQYGDPTVYTAQAAQKFEADTPVGKFKEYVDLSRPVGTHVGGQERYDLMLEQAGIKHVSAVSVAVEQEEVVIHFDHSLEPQAA